jgi:hypothetical protein
MDLTWETLHSDAGFELFRINQKATKDEGHFVVAALFKCERVNKKIVEQLESFLK